LNGNDYIVEEPLTKMRWRIGREKKEFLGYECIKATTKTANGVDVIAWYAPDIPVSDGPSDYWGLPGLILHLEIGELRLLSCTSIEELDEETIIQAPSQGEKISRKQYEKMREEEMERARIEMGERFKGRPGTVTSGTTTIVR
jgi:GLPGLI family protein